MAAAAVAGKGGIIEDRVGGGRPCHSGRAMSFKMILGTAAGLVLSAATLAQTPPKTLSLGNAASNAAILTRE
ncbi:MAG: hypothetical protein KGN16_11345 [Burkholderiales bacterium]|nr:hypothetical protein [Burkholderiales bacterium]